MQSFHALFVSLSFLGYFGWSSFFSNNSFLLLSIILVGHPFQGNKEVFGLLSTVLFPGFFRVLGMVVSPERFYTVLIIFYN